MLNELAQYAHRKRLVDEPGYKSKRVPWLIVFEAGEFVTVSGANSRGAGSSTSPNSERVCPHLEQSDLVAGKEMRSHFLVDSAAVVTGYGCDPADAKKRAKHAAFVKLLHAASESCAELTACARALEDPAVVLAINKVLTERKAKSTDNITFQLDSTVATDLPGWRAWWSVERQAARPASSEKRMVCLLSGEVAPPARTHSKVSGLSQVGGQPSGSNLISFDKEAFASFGLGQSDNAACSETSVARYRAALDDLVGRAGRPLGGSLLLHWFDRQIATDDDPLAGLLDLDDSSSAEANATIRAQQLVEAIRSGRRPDLAPCRYFVLVASATGGRVMVRDWYNGPLSELANRISGWYQDLELVTPSGADAQSDPKLMGLLMRLVSYRPKEQATDTFKRINDQLGPLVPRLWRAALQGQPIPDAAAAAALEYAKSRLYREEGEKAGNNLDRTACCILKAWIVRRHLENHIAAEKDGTTGQQTITSQEAKEIARMDKSLNKEHPSVAYQAGRLMAVLAAVQQSALGDVGAGLVQRYYAAASSTPGLVIGRLIRNSQYHLQKLDPRFANWYEKQIAEVMNRLGTDIPANLDLEGQTLFALGYYQQKAALHRKEEATNNQPDSQEGEN
jgi:CRISPR-associated protein Csd1